MIQLTPQMGYPAKAPKKQGPRIAYSACSRPGPPFDTCRQPALSRASELLTAAPGSLRRATVGPILGRRRRLWTTPSAQPSTPAG